MEKPSKESSYFARSILDAYLKCLKENLQEEGKPFCKIAESVKTIFIIPTKLGIYCTER